MAGSSCERGKAGLDRFRKGYGSVSANFCTVLQQREDGMSVLGGIYEGGGAKPMSWPTVGTSVEGEVVGIRQVQATDYKTKEPETWGDGSPKMIPIVCVQTDLQEDAEDDGRRDIYLRAGSYTAFREALRKAFRTKPEDDDIIGAVLKLQFHKEVPSTGGAPRKVFRARITPKPVEPSADFGWDDEVASPPSRPSKGQRRGPPPEPAAPEWASSEDIPF